MAVRLRQGFTLGALAAMTLCFSGLGFAADGEGFDPEVACSSFAQLKGLTPDEKGYHPQQAQNGLYGCYPKANYALRSPSEHLPADHISFFAEGTAEQVGFFSIDMTSAHRQYVGQDVRFFANEIKVWMSKTIGQPPKAFLDRLSAGKDYNGMINGYTVTLVSAQTREGGVSLELQVTARSFPGEQI